MAEQEKRMNRLPMLENIFAQPESHRGLLDLHAGRGRAALEECANRIRQARGRVIFTGMGASLFAAIPAVDRLLQEGYAAQIAESSELLHYGAVALRPDDVGILISRSGGSIEVLHLAETMRAAGMDIIGVTNVPHSSLEQLADIPLMIGSQPDQLIAVQSYTGTVLTLLLLAEEVVANDSLQFAGSCHAALPKLVDCIEASFHASESWRELLDRGGPPYLLGRGPALASVYEGALLLHETAKASAVGMSAGQFRHGPVECISSESRVMVFGAPEATRDLDRSLADDLFRMGAKVSWIGPPPQDATASHGHAPSLIEWPAVAPVLAPIFDIVPLQVAAYRLALWRGITPGDFRYASEITSAESGFPLFQSKIAAR
jgi:glutamine---fructose-6-phosphate transaminase (isomerizing)